MVRKSLYILILFSGILFSQNRGVNQGFSLFSDFKAINIGDAVTILVVENSQATNSSNISTSKQSDLGYDLSGKMDGEPTLPSLDFDIGSKNDFKGGGGTNSSGSVKARISAMIDSVYANGNLRISGTRKIVINKEEQEIRITGIIRSVDIKSDNTVYSYNISNMELHFEGKGKIDEAQSPGWLTKIFHWLS